MADSLVRPLVEAIHSSSTQAVLYVSGGASQCLGWLMSEPGASNTVLEILVPYSRMSMIQLLGKSPLQFVASQTAEEMALVAYNRALKLSKPARPVLGVGFTGSLASTREKLGDHRFHMCLRTNDRRWTSTVTLAKGMRTREQEDAVSGVLLLQEIGKACKIEMPPCDSRRMMDGDEVVSEIDMRFSEDEELEQVLAGDIAYKLYPFSAGEDMDSGRKIILSGSFNPLHDGHMKLLEAATSISGGGYPCFEISAINADKPSLTTPEIRQRINQFEKLGKAVIVSNQPYFHKKAEIFPGSVFVIGADTVARLIDVRYYGGDAARMSEVLSGCGRRYGCVFLVGGRTVDGVFKVLEDFDIPHHLKDIFISVPPHLFRADISSTNIRARCHPPRDL